MRWLMVSQSTPDQAVGGTEVYVRRLAEALLARGIDVSWVHYAEGEPALAPRKPEDDAISYYQISILQRPEKREQGWRIGSLGLEEFREVLAAVQPDCVHFHGFGRNQSPEHFASAKQVGATVFMTYHAPGQSCARWDLLYKGRDMCMGRIDVSRCTDCALHRMGVPSPLRPLLSRIDLAPLARVLPHSTQHPFMRRRGLKDYQRRWRQGMAMPDRILWHAGWVRDLLLRNHVPEASLHYLPLPPPHRQGYEPACGTPASGIRRFIYIGRLSDIKGVHILTEAVRLLPRTERLDVEIVGAVGPEEYFRAIAAECEKDPRLHLAPPVDVKQIPTLMGSADAVIVPSLWPETGPYTVLEAMWTGTPVVGSDRAGIRELLNRYGGGVWFQPGNARQLARLLVECDFRAMRRDPMAFRAEWMNGFDAALSTLCKVVRIGSEVGPCLSDCARH